MVTAFGPLATISRGRFTDDALARRKPAIDIEGDVKLIDPVDPPARGIEGKMKHLAFGAAEQDRLSVWCIDRKDPDGRPRRRVDDQSRDDPGRVIVQIEAKKRLALSGKAGGRTKGLLPERAREDSQGAEGGARLARCRAQGRRARASGQAAGGKSKQSVGRIAPPGRSEQERAHRRALACAAMTQTGQSRMRRRWFRRRRVGIERT